MGTRQAFLFLLLSACLSALSSAVAQDPLTDISRPAAAGVEVPPAPGLGFDFQPIGPAPSFRPTITNVQIVDLDQDGVQDVVACDSTSHAVYLYRRQDNGAWMERVLGEGLIAPAHATIVDLDQDGDNDVLVSLMGNLLPDDNVIGSLVLLENEGGEFTRKVILDDVRRVVDAQPGDFDGDGDLDLAVAVFGYTRGQVLWLENRGDDGFRDRELHSAAGAIHVPVADYDGDGDLDIATVISQDDEEVWGFENRGGGNFAPRRLWMTVNFDIGSAGLVESDVDGDGDPDLLLPVGDNLEDSYSFPQPYHGCLWLENQGGWNFAAHRIGTFPGTYAAAAGDLDADGDQDVVLCSMVNDWAAGKSSIVWLENDGRQTFTQHDIANDPIKLVTLAVGDLTGDNRADIVAGGLHLYPPYDRLGRISSWIPRPGTASNIPVPPEPADVRDGPAMRSLPPLPNLDWTGENVRSDLTGLRDSVVARVSEGKDTADDWLELGKAYYAFGFFPEATRCFESCVDRNPGLALANYMLGIVLQRMGRIDEALIQLRHTLDIAPRNQMPLIWHEIGRCYLRLEEESRAEDAFKSAGRFPASLVQLARLRIKLGREEEALPVLNDLTRAHPTAIQVFLLKARAAEAMEMHDSAQEFRDRAEYNSRSLPPEPTYGAATIESQKYGSYPADERVKRLLAAKKWDEAVGMLRETIPTTDRIEPVIMLAGAEMERGNPEEAARLLEELMAKRGYESDAMLILGDAYLRSGHPEKAVRVWEELERVRPSEVPMHEKLARHHDRKGESDAARKREALRLESIGITTLRLGKAAAARGPLEEAVTLDPELPRSWFYLGESCRLNDDTAAAKDAYQRVLAINPNHGRAHARLELLAE